MRYFDYKETLTLNIKLLSSLQRKFALLISMQDFERIFNDVFELTNVQRLKFTLNAKSFMKMLESASTKSSVQIFTLLMNVWNFNQMLINVSTKSNTHFELNIKHLSSSQNKLILSKSMQNFLKISELVFKIADIQKIKSATSARSFIKTLENVMSRLNTHSNAFI